MSPGELAGRVGETRTLLDRALDARNSRLEGPRRFGKTSLLRATLAAAEAQGAIGIEVNFLGCITVGDVAERIERAYSVQLDGALRRWFDGLVRTLHPTLSAAPAGVGVKTQPRHEAPGLLDRLALPRRVQARTGRQCVIAFDEFQEVVRIAAQLPGVFRSELETHANAAGYIFSGSHPGLMRDLFADRRHAFFAQAAPVVLGPLRPDDLGEHITNRFAAGRRDPGDALGPLLDVAEGHPQRAMLLAHHLYERTPTGQIADIARWTTAYASARREADGEIQVLWQASTDLERRVLKAIAHRVVPLGGAEAARRFGLAKSGSTQVAVTRLAGDGHLLADPSARTGWRIVDPLLGAWLREED